MRSDLEQLYRELRAYAFSIAYRMLGSVTEAEDVVQEAFVRLGQTDEQIRSDKAYVATLTTRLSFDVLRSARTRCETYVGPWLPEPLLDDRADLAADVADAAETADSLTMAFLVVLETLTPLERAVFVLHDVFGYEYGEVAAVVQSPRRTVGSLRAEPAVASATISRASRRHASNATGWRPASSQPAKGVTSMNWSTCSLVTPPSMAMAARRELV